MGNKTLSCFWIQWEGSHSTEHVVFLLDLCVGTALKTSTSSSSGAFSWEGQGVQTGMSVSQQVRLNRAVERIRLLNAFVCSPDCEVIINSWEYECLFFSRLSLWVSQSMHFAVVSKAALARTEVCTGLKEGRLCPEEFSVSRLWCQKEKMLLLSSSHL